jgi:acetylglutamate kinase
MAQSMGLIPQMIDGRRITDAPMLDGGHDLCWQINKNIVAQLQAHNTNDGISGADGNLIQSEKKPSHHQLRICR